MTTQESDDYDTDGRVILPPVTAEELDDCDKQELAAGLPTATEEFGNCNRHRRIDKQSVRPSDAKPSGYGWWLWTLLLLAAAHHHNERKKEPPYSPSPLSFRRTQPTLPLNRSPQATRVYWNALCALIPTDSSLGNDLASISRECQTKAAQIRRLPSASVHSKALACGAVVAEYLESAAGFARAVEAGLDVDRDLNWTELDQRRIRANAFTSGALAELNSIPGISLPSIPALY